MTRTLFSTPKKVITFGLLCSLCFTSALTPITVFAQSNEPALPQDSGPASSALFPGGTNGGANFELEDAQAAAFQSGQLGQQGFGAGQAVTDVVGSGLSCSAGLILGQLLSSAISSAISSVIQSVVGNTVSTVTGTALTVPVNTTFDAAGQHIVGEARARSGSFTLFGIMTNVSWDSIAWCVVNAMIEHIANSTIAWANSGFNGNPAFLQNPERFFRDLADFQAGTIIRDIAYGASGGRLNICQPFRVNIAIGLAQSYSGFGQNAIDARYRGMSCSLSQIQQQKFFGGVGVSIGERGANIPAGRGFMNWSDWYDVSQFDQNNYFGAYMLANEALYTSVDMRQNELRFEIGLNNGWLNFKKCRNGETDPSKCDTVTPGRLIEAQLNETLGLPKQRLIMAEKFDQMITAIVNNLIRVALNEVLSEVNE